MCICLFASAAAVAIGLLPTEGLAEQFLNACRSFVAIVDLKISRINVWINKAAHQLVCVVDIQQKPFQVMIIMLKVVWLNA